MTSSNIKENSWNTAVLEIAKIMEKRDKEIATLQDNDKTRIRKGYNKQIKDIIKEHYWNTGEIVILKTFNKDGIRVEKTREQVLNCLELENTQ